MKKKSQATTTETAKAVQAYCSECDLVLDPAGRCTNTDCKFLNQKPPAARAGR